MDYITDMKYSVEDITRVMRAKGYTVFDDKVKPYNVNIVGVRHVDNSANLFNDLLTLFYRDGNEWVQKHFEATVDPGSVYLAKPINTTGAAIVMPGQYRGVWRIGFHKGLYQALTQYRPITVARDNNRDTIANSEIPKYTHMVSDTVNGVVVVKYYNLRELVFTTETGMFGINCHKAGKGRTITVDNYSAGCVVLADDREFDNVLMDVCRRAAVIHGNSFSFTLIEQIDFDNV